MAPFSDSVLGSIGNTPLVALDRLRARSRVGPRILAKLEYFSPGGSVKDRAALNMLEDAERSGRLRAGQMVVELTSGNMGIGLAVACAVKGYPFTAVMSEGNSSERWRVMKALGAKVVLVPQAKGGVPGKVTGEDLALVEKKAEELVRRLRRLQGRPVQESCQPRRPLRGHRRGDLGPDRREDRLLRCHSWDGRDLRRHLGGSEEAQSGGQVLRRRARGRARPGREEGDLAQAQDPGDRLRPRPGDLGPFALRRIPDRHRRRGHQDARGCSPGREGILSGFSGGANVAAALKLAKRLSKSAETIVTVIPDTGLKYLSTDLFP